MALLEPAEEWVVGAVLRAVADAEVLVDVAAELANLVLGGRAGGVAPVGHGKHPGKIGGLGVGHDRRDRLAGWEPAGQ